MYILWSATEQCHTAEDNASMWTKPQTEVGIAQQSDNAIKESIGSLNHVVTMHLGKCVVDWISFVTYGGFDEGLGDLNNGNIVWVANTTKASCRKLIILTKTAL